MRREADQAVERKWLLRLLLSGSVVLACACAGRAASSDSSDGAVLTAADAAAALEKCCGDSAIGVGLRIAADYKEPSITTRTFTAEQFWLAVEPMAEYARFDVAIVGRSMQSRPLRTITIGNGPTKVLVWSRTNGNQSAGTMALADIVRWFANTRNEDRDVALRQRLLTDLTIVLLPILNPDDAALSERSVAGEVASGADAARMSGPESQVLEPVRNSLRPDFALYLIDEGARASVADTSSSAAISLHALSNREAVSGTTPDEPSRLLAATLAKSFLTELPGRVKRYSNAAVQTTVMPASGTSTVLIASGDLEADPQHQRLRSLHAAVLLSAFDALATGAYQGADAELYEQLPRAPNGAVTDRR